MAFALLFSFIGGCIHACPAIVVSGLIVTVTDASGADVCNATVTVSIAGETRTLTNTPQLAAASCNYQDEPGGDAGTYEITVTAPGFQNVEQSAKVSKDDCGTDETDNVTIKLAAS